MRISVNPVRRIIEDAPEFIQVPPELRHQRLEVIIWPLEPVQEPTVMPEWPAGLFERTAGAWQGEPLMREPQGDFESREVLE